MKPYYQDEAVTIYHGDCREILPNVEADVLVTDPPYGMSYVSNKSLRGPSRPIGGDETTELRDWLLEFWGNRPALIFGTWKVDRPEARMMLVWDKGDVPGMGDLKLPWGPSHEEIYVRGDGFTGKRRGGVIRVDGYSAGDPRRMGHPTPKPVALMTELLSRCPEGTILDPFTGSGTTLRAAKDLGRKAIGIELEEHYCEIAAQRCAQDVLDLGMAA